ncbi:hypothetical protein TorRG33x02_099950 [Trema orientale]|uniref:Uncharacterized protein n=1 Tax=Trema orientale TaxID=63057 RepID=A0A2P5F8Z7_TREOI|nr:hypothetical protein TorRG33x02_099950 [Trema orientale]
MISGVIFWCFLGLGAQSMWGGSPNVTIKLSLSSSDLFVRALFKEYKKSHTSEKMVKSVDINTETTESDSILREVDQYRGDDEASSARKE